jgi:ASC-1-like (ASCH) protein
MRRGISLIAWFGPDLGFHGVLAGFSDPALFMSPEGPSGGQGTLVSLTDTAGRIHGLNLYRQDFALVAAGTETIEVRIEYPHLAVGDCIRFRIKGTDETCEVKVERVTEYPDFEALLDGEGPTDVNPTASRDEQLANIRAIYPSEKEAPGALAIRIGPIS